MNTFASTQGPFLSGMRPKIFFAARKKMINDASKYSNGGLKYFAGWNRNKKVHPKEKSEVKTSYRVFIESLPWTLVLTQMFYMIIF
jgi:hypothetical protein